MANEQTIDAVRLALGMYQLRAHVASLNIANAGTPGARAVRADFAQAQAALDASAAGAGVSLAQAIAQIAHSPTAVTDAPINLDEQVADMAAAGVGYQALGEALSRQFGLMRLAVTGRS
jgi:flagellar basal body rod protein FlgB